jgi:hypothetical protein
MYYDTQGAFRIADVHRHCQRAGVVAFLIYHIFNDLIWLPGIVFRYTHEPRDCKIMLTYRVLGDSTVLGGSILININWL